MGRPANLPSFTGLAEAIAKITGQNKIKFELEDRFLGRLREKGYRVYLLAATTADQIWFAHVASPGYTPVVQKWTKSENGYHQLRHAV